ncbi:hypothetical protein [Streptomonospora salina]|uniref:Uncharacterized protein n=1 Tax=Streptomonospora salina TaxID=104205 RepID=A0A841EGI7_9ACTN|nr:hypothetical protein [Streptomonospora salina]MBB5999510.1 hypothetical protein [Streptomonospora salina]
MRRAVPAEKRPGLLLYTGTGGSGKSALLGKFEDELRQIVPYAAFDFARAGNDFGLPEVLSVLAFQLGQRCPGYGRLRFHRLVMGRLAMKEKVDFTDHAGARRHVLHVLRNYRGKGRVYDAVWAFTRESAGGLAGAAGLPEPLKSSVGAVAARGIDFIGSRESSGSFLLGESFRWYEHRGRGDTGKPLDSLVKLSAYAGNLADPAKREFVDTTLIEAFLADLRAAFSRGLRAKPGMYDCVLLLDNIDKELGQEFRSRFLAAVKREANTALSPAPLVVAATSRRPSVAETNESRVRVHPLRDLTADEAADLAPTAMPGDVHRRFPGLVHRLTGGHPGATALLFETAAAWPTAAEGGLAKLLAQQHPRDDGDGNAQATVEERLRDDLVRGLSGVPAAADVDRGMLATLAAFAAARSDEDAAWIVSEYLGGSLTGFIGAESLWRSCLWHEGATTGDRVLLRRLLLRWSSQQGDDPVPRLRGRLRERCRTGGDTVGELYHALGAGDVAACSRGLAEKLPETGEETDWVGLLHAVTAVPRVADATGPAPSDPQTEPAGRVGDTCDHLAAVARVAVGLWRVGDPFTVDGRWFLHKRIARDLQELANHAGNPMALYQEAERHGELARDWEE